MDDEEEFFVTLGELTPEQFRIIETAVIAMRLGHVVEVLALQELPVSEWPAAFEMLREMLENG